MISISTVNGNINGNVILNIISDFRENVTRLNRYKTLDGKSVSINGGVSHGDRTLSIEGLISESTSEKLWNLYNIGTGVLVSIVDGIYYAYIKVLRLENGKVNMTIYINNKENI